MLGRQTPQQQVYVRQAERTAKTITSRSRTSSRALGTDAKQIPFEAANGTASRSHRLDFQGWGGDRCRADLVTITVIEIPIETGHVGGGAPHIEGNDFRESRAFGHRRGPNHTARGTAQEAIDGPVVILADQPARTRHDS